MAAAAYSENTPSTRSTLAVPLIVRKWYGQSVESMTDELETAIRSLMDNVEELGGAVAAIEAGYQKREIEQSAYDVATSVEDGSRTVVGVNRFQRPADEVYEPLQVDPTIVAYTQAAGRLASLRRDWSVRPGDVETLVARGESVLATELGGWVEQMNEALEALQARQAEEAKRIEPP